MKFILQKLEKLTRIEPKWKSLKSYTTTVYGWFGAYLDDQQLNYFFPSKKSTKWSWKLLHNLFNLVILDAYMYIWTDIVDIKIKWGCIQAQTGEIPTTGGNEMLWNSFASSYRIGDITWRKKIIAIISLQPFLQEKAEYGKYLQGVVLFSMRTIALTLFSDWNIPWI